MIIFWARAIEGLVAVLTIGAGVAAFFAVGFVPVVIFMGRHLIEKSPFG